MSKFYSPRTNLGKRLFGPLPKGAALDWHEHNFAHDSFVRTGGLRFEGMDKDGKIYAKEIWAHDEKNWIEIYKGQKHRAISLADGTRGVCVYAARDSDGEVIEDDTTPIASASYK